MSRKVLSLLFFIMLALPSYSYAATQTCGSTPGGTGGELFSFNTSWYGHACKFTTATPMDISAISAEISRISTTQTFALAVYADSGNKPSGSALVTGNISSATNNCTVYTATVSTTTIPSGTYWITAVPTTHSLAYICGAGSAATVSDQDNTNAWSTGYAGGYYLALTYTAAPPPPPRIITVTQPVNGFINPGGAVSVNYGSSTTLVTSPAYPWIVIQSLIVDGVVTTASSSYTFSNVTTNHTFSAVLAYDSTLVYGIASSLETTNVLLALALCIFVVISIAKLF